MRNILMTLAAASLVVPSAAALADPEVAPDIEAVAATATTTVSLTSGDSNWTTTLVGTTPSWTEVRSREVTSGRFLDPDDIETAAAVVVLGPDTAAELLTGNPVGQHVSYEGSSLEVIGVLEELSSSDDATNNDLAIVASTTYAQRLIGGPDRNSVSSIYVKATSEATLSAAYQEADATLTLSLIHI